MRFMGRLIGRRGARAAGMKGPGHLSRDRRGSTAIEFAALIIPFSLLVFAILESCVSFAGQQLLSNAADSLARQIRTGQLKAADITEEVVRAEICDSIKILVADDCPELEVDLREFATFADAAKVKIKYVGTGDSRDIDTSDFAVDPGESMSKNMLRVFYRWPVMTDIMRRSLSNLKDGKTLHFASVTWQNEPFQD